MKIGSVLYTVFGFIVYSRTVSTNTKQIICLCFGDIHTSYLLTNTDKPAEFVSPNLLGVWLRLDPVVVLKMSGSQKWLLKIFWK